MKKTRAFFLSTLSVLTAGMLMTGCNRDKDKSGKETEQPSVTPDTASQPGTQPEGGTGTGGTGNDTGMGGTGTDTSMNGGGRDTGMGGTGEDTSMGGSHDTGTGGSSEGSSGGAPSGSPGGSSGGY